MLYRLQLSPFINIALLVFTAHAGTPPRYPFDRPSFGHPLCDNSLPNPPRENPVLKKAALDKIESTGGNSAGRAEPQLPTPYLPPNSLKRTILSPIIASPEPGKDGVLPTSLFQHWEQPILYHIFASASTANLIVTRDPTTIDKINSLVSDVLNTCCQFGFDGAAFGRFSETEGDYVEVHVQFSPTPPISSSAPLAIEGGNGGRRGPLGLPFLSRVGSRPSPPRAWSSVLERVRPGRMVLSPSREDLLQAAINNSTTSSPAGSGELSSVPEGLPARLPTSPNLSNLSPEGPFAFQPVTSRRFSTSDIETGLVEPDPSEAGPSNTGPSNNGPPNSRESAEAAAAMRSIMQTEMLQTAATQFSLIAPEEQVLLRQCRDAMVELNMRGQTQQETSNEIEIRETWCKNCCPSISGFLNNHQGATGCCIMSMVFISTVVTVLNYIHALNANSTSSGFSPPMPPAMPPGLPPGS